GPIMAVVDLRNPHGSTGREAVVVSSRNRPEQSLGTAGKRLPRVQSFIRKIVVTGTVQLVGTRPHGHVEKPATGLAELGRVVTGLNRELLNGVDARLRFLRGPIGEPKRGILPFDAKTLRITGRSIDADGVVGRPIGARD